MATRNRTSNKNDTSANKKSNKNATTLVDNTSEVQQNQGMQVTSNTQVDATQNSASAIKEFHDSVTFSSVVQEILQNQLDNSEEVSDNSFIATNQESTEMKQTQQETNLKSQAQIMKDSQSVVETDSETVDNSIVVVQDNTTPADEPTNSNLPQFNFDKIQKVKDGVWQGTISQFVEAGLKLNGKHTDQVSMSVFGRYGMLNQVAIKKPARGKPAAVYMIDVTKGGFSL